MPITTNKLSCRDNSYAFNAVASIDVLQLRMVDRIRILEDENSSSSKKSIARTQLVQIQQQHDNIVANIIARGKG